MKIKFLCAAAAVSTVLASTAAFAEDAPAAPAPDITITGTAALVSQYRFRGISQSDQKPAVQASFTLSHKSGFYVSAWGSSASAGSSAVDIGGTEIDIYGGYTHALGKTGLTFDGGLYGYLYPGGAAANRKNGYGNIASNYYELYASLTEAIGPFSLKAGLNWAPKQDYFTDFGTKTKFNVYKYVELSASVPNTALSIHTHLAHNAGGFNWTKQYIDYTVGASYKVKALTFDVSLVGTNVSHRDAGFATPEVYRATKPVAVFSLTAGF